MKMTFTVVAFNGKEHTSKVINDVESWKHAAMCAVVHAHEVALEHETTVKIKSIQRIDV